jgi:hypothetical protein
MFPGQYPQVGGPATRLHFSIMEQPSQVLQLNLGDDTPVRKTDNMTMLWMCDMEQFELIYLIKD